VQPVKAVDAKKIRVTYKGALKNGQAKDPEIGKSGAIS